MEDNELRNRIGDLAYEVTQNAATERPFTGEYDDFFEKGIYVDVVSGEVLFSSEDKFNSGCGWPAFSKPAVPDALKEKTDTSFGMVRTEVRSSEANSHLGHVFPDAPDLDYHNLEGVHNGAEASAAFAAMAEMDPVQLEEYREHLLRYCELDTYAMVKIWEKLSNL